MNIDIFNNLRFEYSVGATVIILSLIDTSIDKSVLKSNNVSKILIEYSYGGNNYVKEQNLVFHVNSILIFIDNLPQNTNIKLTPYIELYDSSERLQYRIRLTDTITEKTLPYGNVTYRIIPTENSANDQIVENTLSTIIRYINEVGTYINEDYNEYAPYAKTIPVRYNGGILTANAYYYRMNIELDNDEEVWGLIQTSGGVYAKNSVLFHELRHRYGINDAWWSYFERDRDEGRSDLFSYIKDEYTVVHDALRFESGREDAKVWIFDAHSNILEGDYTNDGVYNYLAANYIKALAWYTSHSVDEEDTSKIRKIAEINIYVVFERNINEVENIETSEEYIIGYSNNQKIINIGKYQYLIEYYTNGINYVDNIVNKFKLLRNFEITNDIIYDKDIFFVEESIYEKTLNDIKDGLPITEICFPIYKNNKLAFSNSNELFSTYQFSELEDIAYDIYENNDNIANIKCDKVRIYLPTIKKDLDFIIYIDNYINNIHFHYLCSLNSNFIKKCEKEIKIGNNIFIEYIEFKIPNIQHLFNHHYYIIDEYNNIIESTATNISEYFDSKHNKDLDVKTNKVYLEKFIQPYLIKDNSKIFINNDSFNYNINYMNKNIIKITLYPYSDVLNHIYINSSINPTTTFLYNENYFRLHSELGFDCNVISILNKFEFPGKIEQEDNYYDIDIYGDYNQNEYHDKYYNQVTEYYNSYYLNDNIEYLINSENEDLDIENIRTTGYVIQIANDMNFNDVVFESVINTDNNNDNFIYDFSFSLNNIVHSWNQLNEILVIRTKFIDKRLNNIIIGNNVVLTKEWFKYLINDMDDTTSVVIFKQQNQLNLINTYSDKNNRLLTFMDFNQGFNFIDKINCVVRENQKEQLDIQIQNQNTQIIYKPIFYKVQDLQNIKIKESVVQKIGINLGDYMTKIKLFILNINGANIKEYSRNDIYVIFEVNANLIEDNSGTYMILDENFEYISSGNYTLY